jgi:uncharacterized protein (TIGR02246 family)
MEMNDIANQLGTWCESITGGDAGKVMELYAEDAVLVPTLSGDPIRDRIGIRDYFVAFLAKNPIARLVESSPRTFGEIAVCSGLYTFDLVGDRSRTVVDARFTFVYRLIDERWLIIEHHSSARP